MTINAPAMWLLALYVSVAREQAEAEGRDVGEVLAKLTGTTQTTSSRSTLSRGTYIFRRAEPAADHRHDRVDGAPRAEVEPDQHL